MLKIILVFWLGAISSHAFDSKSLHFPVTKKTLPNGLTVLMHEDHSLPTISYQTWFRVGSRDEEPQYTGIAHLFEHMMFKGAKRYSGLDFDRILKANGVTNNAFTTRDFTAYYEDLPSDKLELIMDMESDRLENLQLTESNFTSEREVVKEERRLRVDNSLDGVLDEVLWNTAFKVHPYTWPVIGWMEDLNRITLEKCKAFFRTFYSAPNAVIVISGDFDSNKASSLIEKYYGHLPKVEIRRRPYDMEPISKVSQAKVVEKPAENERLILAYRIERQGHPLSYAMDLVNNILTEGESSRLYKRLVYELQLAIGVEAASYTPRDPGLFYIEIDLKPGVSHKKILATVLEEVEGLSKKPFTESEITKAKNQAISQWVSGLKTIHKKAQALAINEIMTGNYQDLFNDLDTYQKLTVEDLTKAVRQFLIPTNRTQLVLMPSKGGP